ncbi:phage tail protein [Burkholderia vietnamiensis]|nr:phage tail protein [Burkholderia vietnamiensis]
MYVASASSTATLTADEIIVGAALGGHAYKVGSINQTINLAGANGIGGMDTGSAPASGYVAIYEMLNPTTGAKGLMAVNATSSVAPSIYGGANMPAGYTASALLTVVPTNGSGQFKSVLVNDRSVSIPIATALSTSTIQTSPTLLSIASIVPANAKSIRGELQATSSSASQLNVTVVADSVGQLSQQNITGQGGSAYTGNYSMDLATPQQIYYTANSTAGTPSFTIYVSGYSL